MTDPIRTALERLVKAIPSARAALANAEPPAADYLAQRGWPAPTGKDSLQVAQPAEASHGPSIEELGPLIAYLAEVSCQAANAGRSRDAGMLCWAMQVVSECVDEDAPDPASVVKDSLTTAPPELQRPWSGEVAAWSARLRPADPALPAEGENIDRSQISDGYHTFAELYDHRHSLMLALMRALPHLCWFSQRHHDGELPFGSADWFIVGAELPMGAITYHLPIGLLPLAQQTGAVELTVGRPWDGHTASDVIERLRAWVGSPQFAPPGEVPPSGYAYRYPDGIRFNGGGEVNGSRPIEAMPYWFSPPVPATPPTEGEVAELVKELKEHAHYINEEDKLGEPVDTDLPPLLTRAAELLQQRYPAPVAVSERPPGPNDCNARGQCWQEEPGSYTEPPGWYLEYYRSIIAYGHCRWLPFHALPLPAGEGEQ